MTEARKYVMERIVVHPKSRCWIWIGTRRSNGYGKVKFKGNQSGAHRFSYIAFEGPTDLVLDHLCRRKLCVNPLHLDPVTQAENNRRALLFRKPKSHCIHGHAYTEGNTYVDKKGVMRCMECARIGRLRSYYRKRG